MVGLDFEDFSALIKKREYIFSTTVGYYELLRKGYAVYLLS